MSSKKFCIQRTRLLIPLVVTFDFIPFLFSKGSYAVAARVYNGPWEVLLQLFSQPHHVFVLATHCPLQRLRFNHEVNHRTAEEPTFFYRCATIQDTLPT